MLSSGCGAAWLARLSGGQEVVGSNPASPTNETSSSDPASGIAEAGSLRVYPFRHPLRRQGARAVPTASSKTERS